ncbi:MULTISPECIES: hypothetical protein [unclassified Variovorax]|uniref:hypothetical protein n=1 Tax=unclassified Variovorax TaxID=663243 RepID=UPI0008397772|nr:MULTISPECIES: hypothetical protein [unclassified Variovorax]PNG53320.1 hypothetical protein CHC06_04667 [Variovorax sp. B2]PNG53892.1 hypothetical protein CHC07_03714 [Variovorax sp. B4]VTV11357.1 hypothetical protein WDL1CHR_02228 [Variovorax sp. WDL1]
MERKTETPGELLHNDDLAAIREAADVIANPCACNGHANRFKALADRLHNIVRRLQTRDS